MSFEHVIFDLDGTLTNPALGITNSIIYALKKMDVEPPEREKLYCCIGPPLIGCFESLFNMSRQEAERALALYREYFSVTGLFENEVYEGIDDLLASLCKSNKKIYLATSKPEEFATEILKHFDLYKYFTFVAGNTLSEDRPKKLDVLKYLLKTYPEISAENSVMIGDTAYDAAGSRDAGLDCIGVLYGFGSREDFEREGAKHIVTSVSELKNLLLKEGR